MAATVEVLAGLASVDVATLDDDGLVAYAEGLVAARKRLDAAELAAVAEVDERSVSDTTVGLVTQAWLATEAGLPRGRATGRLRVARALAGDLVVARDALAEGRIGFEHAAVLVAGCNPRIVEPFVALVPALIDDAQVMTFERWRRHVGELVALLDEDGPAPPEERTNRLSISRTLDGRVRLAATFDALEGTYVLQVIDARADDLFRRYRADAEHHMAITVPDRATLRALALAELLRDALAAGRPPTPDPAERSDHAHPGADDEPDHAFGSGGTAPEHGEAGRATGPPPDGSMRAEADEAMGPVPGGSVGAEADEAIGPAPGGPLSRPSPPDGEARSGPRPTSVDRPPTGGQSCRPSDPPAEGDRAPCSADPPPPPPPPAREPDATGVTPAHDEGTIPAGQAGPGTTGDASGPRGTRRESGVNAPGLEPDRGPPTPTPRPTPGRTRPVLRRAGHAEITLVVNAAEPGIIRTPDGVTLHPDAAAHLVCDAAYRPLLLDDLGEPLTLGRERRYATDAQRRALAVRDGACAFPGCTAPPAWCDAHHIVYFGRPGGDTVPDNLVLLCRHHHRITHRPGWSLTRHPTGHLTWTNPWGTQLHGQRHGTRREPPDDTTERRAA